MSDLLEGKTEPYRGTDEPCKQCSKPFKQWPHFGLVGGRPSLVRVAVCFDCYAEHLRLGSDS